MSPGSRRAGTRRDERGSITVMALGFVVVLGMLTVLVVNASQAYLERQRLTNLADGAAIAAADGLDVDAFHAGGEVRLDPAVARTLVADHLAGTDLAVVSVSVEADAVAVRLERLVDLALVPTGWVERTRVVAEASAELRSVP